MFLIPDESILVLFVPLAKSLYLDVALACVRLARVKDLRVYTNRRKPPVLAVNSIAQYHKRDRRYVFQSESKGVL